MDFLFVFLEFDSMDRTRVQVPRNLGFGGALVWRIGKQRPVSRKKSIVIEIVNKILDIVSKEFSLTWLIKTDL
jgi:hypothetical protein